MERTENEKIMQKKRMNKKAILKIVVSVLIAALTALGAAIGLSSCNVTRTMPSIRVHKNGQLTIIH